MFMTDRICEILPKAMKSSRMKSKEIFASGNPGLVCVEIFIMILIDSFRPTSLIIQVFLKCKKSQFSRSIINEHFKAFTKLVIWRYETKKVDSKSLVEWTT